MKIFNLAWNKLKNRDALIFHIWSCLFAAVARSKKTGVVSNKKGPQWSRKWASPRHYTDVTSPLRIGRKYIKLYKLVPAILSVQRERAFKQSHACRLIKLPTHSYCMDSAVSNAALQCNLSHESVKEMAVVNSNLQLQNSYWRCKRIWNQEFQSIFIYFWLVFAASWQEMIRPGMDTCLCEPETLLAGNFKMHIIQISPCAVAGKTAKSSSRVYGLIRCLSLP